MIPIMTTHMRSLLIIPALALLSACNPEKKDDPLEPEREAIDITSDNTVLSFSSEAQGDYPVVTNLSLNNSVSAHPVVATIPELFKLEQADELEQYLQSSEALGFDREAFDNFYNVAWELIEAVRYSFVEDAMARQVNHADDIPQQLTIIRTLDPGERGRKVSFRYAINQTYKSKHCKRTEASCEFDVEVDILFYFPESRNTMSSEIGYLYLWWDTMQIQIMKFQIQNTTASLDLNPEKVNIIHADFISELLFDENTDNSSTTTTSHDGSKNNFGVKGLKAQFSNRFTDENGTEKTLTLTGRIHASFPEYTYYRNFLDDNYTYPAFTDQFGKLDEDNVAPLARNTMTGYLWGVDVEVQFATDIHE